ncbi:hypothetical protein ACUOFC_59545, partial [Escherichia sp. TWPC-MK]
KLIVTASGGARFSFSWPLWHNIPQFTSA